MITALKTESRGSVSDVRARAERLHQEEQQRRRQWQEDQVAVDDRVAGELADRGLVLSSEEVSRLAAEGNWDTLLEVAWAMTERVRFIEDQLRDCALFYGVPTGSGLVWTQGGIARRG